MSERERTGTRDLVYSRWHRTHRIARLLGGDQRAAYELSVIDIDWCEYCRWCQTPLALIETQASHGDPKRAAVTQRLAEKAGIQAWSVSYIVEDDDIAWFKRRQLAPVFGPVLSEAPDDYARWLLSLRWSHRWNCSATGRGYWTGVA